MPGFETTIVPKNFKVLSSKTSGKDIFVDIAFIGTRSCPHCHSAKLRKKGYLPPQNLKHKIINHQIVTLVVHRQKFCCYQCGKYSQDPSPESKPHARCATDSFKRFLSELILNGQTIRSLSQLTKISENTLMNFLKNFVARKAQEKINTPYPQIIGIDEKKFNSKLGFITVISDLSRGNKLLDLGLGKSSQSIENLILSRPGRTNVKYVFADLAPTNKTIVKKYFPNAQIVADRYHVVSIINRHFMWAWGEIDPTARKNRSLSSLMRYHQWRLPKEKQSILNQYLQSQPLVLALYQLKQSLIKICLSRVYNHRQAKKNIKNFLHLIELMETKGGHILKALAKTLSSWREEIVRMWRFSKTNSITEGINRVLQGINIKAYGMRNFQNFRLIALAKLG